MKIVLTCLIGIFGLIYFTTSQGTWLKIPNHNEQFLLSLEQVNSLTEARHKCADGNAILLPFWKNTVAAYMDKYLLNLVCKLWSS